MTDYLFLDRETAVRDAVMGLARLHPDLLDVSTDPLYLVAREPNPRRRVGIVSGGGSGHEPMHSGFVGRGGLDAAVPGGIFASPHNRQIYQASHVVTRSGGVLHIVKNYTGDRINFGIAAERLRGEGIAVGRVLIDDDLASGAEGTATGRRGTGGTVIVEKLLGAAADDGLELDALVTLGEEIVSRTRSLAAAWRPHTSPSTGAPAFDIAAGKLEYGVGIHGERATVTPVAPPAEVIDRMLDDLLSAVDPAEDGVLLLVNGLGGVTQLELSGIFQGIAARLDARGLVLHGAMVGTLVAALDMRGISLTLTASRPEWIDWWRRPTGAVAFPVTSPLGGLPIAPMDAATGELPDRDWSDPVLARFAERVTQSHSTLTAWDQAAGDGDFGDNLAQGLALARRHEPTAGEGFPAAAAAFLDDVGGSSGPLLGLLFESLATAFAAVGSSPPERARALGVGLAEGLAAIRRVGEAAPGDRTMVDALDTAVQRVSPTASADDIALGAIEGAVSTSNMLARHGRASYVGDHALGTPDPGAVGIAILLTAFAEAASDSSRAASALEALLEEEPHTN